ncbi:hypothetical protein C490_06754 [Natronobacterium gregoryi SP2]|uniref:Uncharacterized protein n=1 Tax=Natronobacterium gregoryi (strain ATCC 43098 / DSM 3393 / CCM 3738 / CIP 104747 / IAM 13177 / JCM 8860 / NBRC 102187 / NCIMB 2189 / SP2) TaxID=797304 RepID=L9Y9B0_NATGS|nr:hypothetical protein C490_06754 [Natronobacterium gregoryi SP2]
MDNGYDRLLPRHPVSALPNRERCLLHVLSKLSRDVAVATIVTRTSRPRFDPGRLTANESWS